MLHLFQEGSTPILDTIFSKIFGRSDSAPDIPVGRVLPASPAPATTTAAPATLAPPPAEPALNQAISQVDVEEVLDGLNAKSGHALNWKTSIVDLMKLVGLESSLSERKELAKELGYTGDTNDSAKMNVWLHGQVMQKLAANGGKVPASVLKN